ncbi:MAG: tape measure protein, partial [Tannerellaceae bacterium]
MSTEVGSLNASLTLDLGNFKAGMSEAASLAAQLGAQLQSIFSGNAGFSRMSAEVMELVTQIGILRGSMEAFQASMQATTGADLFAQMRTNTAALPAEIASISSALAGVMTNASQLNSVFQSAAISLSEAAAAATLLTTNTSTGASGLNFTAPLAQLTEMQALLNTMLTTMQQVNTIDMSTGAISGEGDQLPIFYGLLTTVQEISAEFMKISGLIQQCTNDTGAWLAQLGLVKTATGDIQRQVRIASGVAGGTAKGTKAAADGAKNLANQTGKASKNLQTTKGYAISINGILGGIVIAQSFYALLNVMEELVSGAIKFSETMQDAGVAFKYLMQDSAVSSGAFLNALKDIALQSPLDTTDLASASRKLMAMGFSANATVPALQTLTDTAAVFSNGAGDMSDMIDHIALAFGQMMASGKVSAQELRQLYNAGLPIYQLLSDGLGISMEMAKNIGHYNVDSATAVYAVLDQLQKKYGGAAKEMTTTMTGAMEMIREGMQQLISYGWSDTFNALTSKVASFSQYIRALVKITQAYGIGGLFQALFPPSTWSTLRSLIAGFQSVGLAIKQMFQIAAQAFGGGLQIIGMIASTVLPVIGGIANGLLTMARAALAASPALRLILSLIAALVIGGIVAKAVLFLAKAIWLLTGAKAAAKAVMTLIGSLIGFGAAHPVALTVLVAISAAFLAIVASSQKARAAIASFFGGIGSKFNDFTQKLGLGFDPGAVAMPEFKTPDLGDFTSGIDDLTKGMDDLTKSTDKAGKSAKKNLQSFDEVFSIDNDASGGASDAMSGISDAINAIGGMNYDGLFDWTGDWAKDWGNISAGLGDIGDSMGDIFGDMGSLASNFWGNIKDALMQNPEVTGALLGAAIGAVIGGLIGGKAGALIGAAIGALAGYIVGDFWNRLAEKWGLGPEAGTQATIATAIGGGIGALIGAIFGGKFGAVIGGIIGGALGGFGKLVWENLQESFGISDEAGARNLGTAIFTGIANALKYVITSIGKSLAEFGWSGLFSSLGTILKKGLLKGIGGALAGIGLSFLTDWIVGAVGKAVGKSEAEIATAEEWSSWGGS